MGIWYFLLCLIFQICCIYLFACAAVSYMFLLLLVQVRMAMKCYMGHLMEEWGLYRSESMIYVFLRKLALILTIFLLRSQISVVSSMSCLSRWYAFSLLKIFESDLRWNAHFVVVTLIIKYQFFKKNSTEMSVLSASFRLAPLHKWELPNEKRSGGKKCTLEVGSLITLSTGLWIFKN